MSSEAIAKVVRDIRTGRVVDPSQAATADPKMISDLRHVHLALIGMAKSLPCPVIDSTAVYEQILNGPVVDLYGDYRIMPVWENALIGYENEFGNVFVVQVYMVSKWQSMEEVAWKTENEVEWDKITHCFTGVLWGGGRSKGAHVETIGPLYRWDVACYEDGAMADIRWTALYDFGRGKEDNRHQNAMMIWLQTYTLAGCTNVELVTPQRSKPERKRLARLDVNPQTIVIKKTSKSYRHHKDDTKDMIGGVPQRFVRGHFARYGAEYDRGLLFGKYSGKFWIPARAVGDSGRDIDYIPESA